MPTRTVRRLAAVTLALAAALTWLPAAHAAGVVNIDSCQILSIPNTTYKLTQDITACGTCFVVAGDRITVDLQGHSLIWTCPGAGITDNGLPISLTVVKNGAIGGFGFGIGLSGTRASVIGVEANGNLFAGIVVFGTGSLVKSSVARNNGLWESTSASEARCSSPMPAATGKLASKPQEGTAS